MYIIGEPTIWIRNVDYDTRRITMELKSTLKVFNEEEVSSSLGIGGEGQTIRVLVGNEQHPSERMMVITKTFDAGTHEKLHWHLIEAFYYIIAGKGRLKDVEGKTYDLRPGTFIYAPPGIAGSHEWEIQEPLKLIAFRATADGERIIQFEVDKTTKVSSIAYDYLTKWAGTQFKKSFY
jgi:quercetin dioxygenase-like cupin family protein